MYECRNFNYIIELNAFLNENKIYPKDIVNITCVKNEYNKLMWYLIYYVNNE